MHACMHACIHTYIHTYIHIYIHKTYSVQIYMYIYICHAFIYINTYMFMCMCVYIHTHTVSHVCMYSCVLSVSCFWLIRIFTRWVSGCGPESDGSIWWILQKSGAPTMGPAYSDHSYKDPEMGLPFFGNSHFVLKKQAEL